MSSVEEDRKLIQIVQYHQVLWDNRTKGFRDKSLTQHAWESVAELLERDVDDVVHRWRSLRKQYSRKVAQLRQNGCESPENPWHLMSLLNFLGPCITPRKTQSNTQQTNYTSTEELSSSSMSDGSLELSPLLIHLNPVDEVATKSYQIPVKTSKDSKSFTTTTPQSSGTKIKKHFRPILPKLTPELPVIKATNKPTGARTHKDKEQSDTSSSLPGVVPKAPRQESSTHKSSTPVSKAQSIDVKPVIKPPEPKNKKLKTSTENCPSSDTKCVNESSGIERYGGYDADEHFLLSLAPELRKMNQKQNLQAKVRFLDILSEQYNKN